MPVVWEREFITKCKNIPFFKEDVNAENKKIIKKSLRAFFPLEAISQF